MSDIFRLRVFTSITGIDSEDVVYKLAGTTMVRPIAFPLVGEDAVCIIRNLCDILQDVVATAESKIGQDPPYGGGTNDVFEGEGKIVNELRYGGYQ